MGRETVLPTSSSLLRRRVMGRLILRHSGYGWRPGPWRRRPSCPAHRGRRCGRPLAPRHRLAACRVARRCRGGRAAEWACGCCGRGRSGVRGRRRIVSVCGACAAPERLWPSSAVRPDRVVDCGLSSLGDSTSTSCRSVLVIHADWDCAASRNRVRMAHGMFGWYSSPASRSAETESRGGAEPALTVAILTH